jgi:hypothetical protein
MSRRVRRAAALDPELEARIDQILRAMRAAGALSAGAHDEAQRAPLRFARSALRE